MFTIQVAALNPIKIAAVKSVIERFHLFDTPNVQGISVTSGVSEQPMSLNETIQGAKKRALNAYQNADLSFGIESGLLYLTGEKQYLDICACCIYDGKNYSLGLSSAFQLPPMVLQQIHEKGLDLSEALNVSGLTQNKAIGQSEGAIGLLSNHKITRQSYTEQAVLTALIPLENAQLYFES